MERGISAGHASEGDIYSQNSSDNPETSTGGIKDSSFEDFPDLVEDPSPVDWPLSRPIASNEDRLFRPLRILQSLFSDRLELAIASVHPTPDWMAEGDQDSSWFGRNMASAGDVNNDGYDDLIVGAMLFDGDLVDEGEALVFHGSPSGLTSAAAWMIEGDEEEALLGYEVEGIGDINGDGYDDVIVSGLFHNSTSNAGKAMVFHGGPGGLPSVH